MTTKETGSGKTTTTTTKQFQAISRMFLKPYFIVKWSSPSLHWLKFRNPNENSSCLLAPRPEHIQSHLLHTFCQPASNQSNKRHWAGPAPLHPVILVVLVHNDVSAAYGVTSETESHSHVLDIPSANHTTRPTWAARQRRILFSKIQRACWHWQTEIWNEKSRLACRWYGGYAGCQSSRLLQICCGEQAEVKASKMTEITDWRTNQPSEFASGLGSSEAVVDQLETLPACHNKATMTSHCGSPGQMWAEKGQRLTITYLTNVGGRWLWD